AESIQEPTAPPASRKPAQGSSVNVVAPANGRRYHSIGSGSGASHGVARTTGVTIAAATAAPARSQPRDHDPRPRPQRTAPASIASPMTLRMSTLSSVLYASPPL